MGMFVVLSQPTQNEPALGAAVAKVYPNESLQLNDRAWLVSARGTAIEVSNALNASTGAQGFVIVMNLSGDYFGWAASNTWAWMKAKFEAANRA